MVMLKHKPVRDPVAEITESHDRFIAGFYRKANGNYQQVVNEAVCIVFYRRGEWGWVVNYLGHKRWSRWEGFETAGNAMVDLWGEVFCPCWVGTNEPNQQR